MNQNQIQIFKETDTNKNQVQFIVKVNGFIESVFKSESEAREFVENYKEPIEELILAKPLS